MSARHRLLVIDYEPRSLKRTLALLEGTGFAVSGAGNAVEIANELNRAAPDAVIVEPMIPGQDGFKLIQTIKRLRPERPTFVIAASRIYRGPRFRGMAKEAGADLFVERPAQEEQILAALTRTLGEQPEATAPVPPEEVSAADMSASPMAAAPGSAITVPPLPIHAPSPPGAGIPAPIPRPAASAPKPSVAATGRPVGTAASAGRLAIGAGPRLSSPIPVVQSSDAEIDAALDRLLGPFGAATAVAQVPPPAVLADPPPPAKPAPSAPSAVPAELDAADPLGLSLDDDFRSRRPEPRKVTGPLVAFDLDEIVAGGPPRPVVIPTRVEPDVAAAPPASSVPAEALGFDLVTGDSDGISAPAAPDDARESRYMDYLLQEDPGTGPPPIDPHAPLRTGPIAAMAPDPPSPSADDDDIDRVLARVFAPGISSQGGIPGIDGEPWPAQPVSGGVGDQGGQPSGPAPDQPSPARPVPEGLRGMDAGTADLLSSLEELENSLPDGGPPSSDLRADSTWTATSGFGDLTGQALQEIETSVPFTPPPPPEDERTLQEVLARISMEAQPTAEEVDPALASPPVQFDAFRQTGTHYGVRGWTGPAAQGTAPTAEDLPARPAVPNAVAVSSRALLTGALVAVLLLALAAGGWYLFVRESAAPSGTPAAPAATSGGEPMRFPAAPAPVSGKKKPKLKRPTAGQDSGVTRPVPGGEKKPRESSRAPAGTAPPGAKPTPVAAVPAVARPEPVPAALRTPPSDAGSRRDRPMSAADARVSAADIAPPAPAAVPPAAPEAPAATSEATDPEGSPIVRANELDAPIRATERAVPPPTAEAIAARVGGRAFLNVLVSGDGSVQDVRLMIDPGRGLGEAARHAARAWRYTAPRREGQPVRVWKTEVVEFELPADEAGDGAESR